VEAARNAAEMASRFGRGHPDYRRVELELAAVRAEIMLEARRVVASLGAQAETVRRHEAELLRRLEEAREVATESGSRRAELQELQKEADARRLLYNSLLERAERTAVEPGPLHQLHPGARIVSAAVAPGVPSSPRPALTGAVGFAGGLAMGGLLALMGGRRSFARTEDLQERIGIPALAAVPRAAQGGLAEAVAMRRNGPEAEALRLLRSGLRFAGRGGTRVVLFVAATRGEGASGMAAAYARLAALDGIDTLLLEGDLRQPSLAALLGASGGRNLLRVLEGRGGWRDAVGRDPASPLHILLAETAQDASYRLLDRHQMQNLLRDAAEDYKLIVLDAPAIGAAPDALLLARHADAICLVVAAGATGEAAVRDAVDRLRHATTAQVVAVLNRAG
jgi:Mrp family chromosome partitioning ATPase